MIIPIKCVVIADNCFLQNSICTLYFACSLPYRLSSIDASFQSLQFSADDDSGRKHHITINLSAQVLMVKILSLFSTMCTNLERYSSGKKYHFGVNLFMYKRIKFNTTWCTLSRHIFDEWVMSKVNLSCYSTC